MENLLLDLSELFEVAMWCITGFALIIFVWIIVELGKDLFTGSHSGRREVRSVLNDVKYIVRGHN